MYDRGQAGTFKRPLDRVPMQQDTEGTNRLYTQTSLNTYTINKYVFRSPSQDFAKKLISE